MASLHHHLSLQTTNDDHLERLERLAYTHLCLSSDLLQAAKRIAETTPYGDLRRRSEEHYRRLLDLHQKVEERYQRLKTDNLIIT